MNYATMQEAGLWQAFKRSDALALSEIYKRFVNELYNYGYHFVMDAGRVQDAIQDVFADLWRTRENLSDTTSVKYYLFCCLRRRLGRKNDFPGHLSEWTEENGADLHTDSAEIVMIRVEESVQQMRRLQQAIATLPFRQQEVIRLRFYDDFSWAEIAGILEINEQSVRNLVQRAVLKLRQLC